MENNKTDKGANKRSYAKMLKSGYFTYLLAVLTMVILPIHFNYLPPLMMVWGVFWILENYPDFNRLRYSPKVIRLIFCAFISYYIFQVLGLFYSEDLKMGLSNSFGRLSLVLFPLLLFYPGEMIKNKVMTLLRIFTLSTAAYLVLCLGYATYRSIEIVNGIWIFNPHPPEYAYLSYYYGSDLTVFQHPSYFAMYVILSAFIAFEAWFDNSLKIQMRALWLLLALILLISLFFLSSRAGLLAAIILIPVYFFQKLKKLNKSKLVFIGILVLLFISIPLLLKNQRVQYLYDEILQKESIGENKEEPRVIIWKSASKLILGNFVLGVGIGDVRDELVKEYISRGETEMVELKLNAHNQFVEVFLENGVIGFFLFLIIIGLMVYAAITGKNLLYGVFILMMLIFFIFESILYRFAGVSFFSFFSLLLFYYKPAMINTE